MQAMTSTPSRDVDLPAAGGGFPSPAGAAEVEHAVLGPAAGSVVVVAVSLLWLATGIGTALALARRGAFPGRWTPLAAPLGPVLAAWAAWVALRRRLRSRRRAEVAVDPVEVSPGARGRGDLSILIAVLAEPEGVADADPLVQRLGDRVGEIVLVRPIGVRAQDDGSWSEVEVAATRALSQAALFVWGPEPRLVLVPGRWARAVARFIGEHRPDLVVVVGGPMANAALSRSPELRDRAVLRASQVSGGPRRWGW